MNEKFPIAYFIYLVRLFEQPILKIYAQLINDIANQKPIVESSFSCTSNWRCFTWNWFMRTFLYWILSCQNRFFFEDYIV